MEMLVRQAFIIIFVCRIRDVIAENGTFYTILNATEKFFEFKARYNKVYNSTKDEEDHYLAFVRNLNEAASLNETVSNTDSYYVLNKYADLYPAEVEEHYGIHLKTNYKVEKGDDKEFLNSNQGIDINNDNLHDINNAEAIFNKYLEEQRRNITENRNNFVNFYKFVRKLVEKNTDALKQNTPIVSKNDLRTPKKVVKILKLNENNQVKDGDYRDWIQSNRGIEVNDTYLYNLRNSKPLFEKYKEEQNRQYKPGQRESYLHYYRFVKTLVETNRAVFDGRSNGELNDKADVLKESQEFFY